jgi:hypothetical protein
MLLAISGVMIRRWNGNANSTLKLTMMKKRIFIFLSLVAIVSGSQAQEANYDESMVPEYTLPDLLTAEDGSKVKTATDWEKIRRPEVLSLFEQFVYGRVPDGDYIQSNEVLIHQQNALEGKADRYEIKISIEKNDRVLSFNLLVYLPAGVSEPVPVFMGYNFNGNHTINPDPGILITDGWVRNREETMVVNNQANERSRGMSASRWPVEMILDRGYGLATIYYGDVDPDYDDAFQNGIHPLFYGPGQNFPEKEEWGSIAAWAWGLSRAMDYLVTWEAIDPERVSVMGHSRLGKTSLWAGAADERFAMVVSNNSGCGGAALSRREFGETVERINTSFPHWFCQNFHDYNKRVNDLPVDQHMLIALIAPRPVYIASAVEDNWADPRGEYLSGYHAARVYNLYNPTVLDFESPEIDAPVKDTKIGYHIRSGGHDVTKFDWQQYLDFADHHLGK